jgi:hypothetical protein
VLEDPLRYSVGSALRGLDVVRIGRALQQIQLAGQSFSRVIIG